ncbi:ITA7 protein, partial [Dromaius novaehollandiae]|nr:ITA7 protein [Dromaius novaehollandiae]
LLVGAPQAPALPGQGANRTGGLFACPLSPASSDCWRVPIDDGVDLQRESKENQWLGVSVKSQGAGGKIVTCAHLYEARHRVRQPLETRDVIGRCFVLSQDLRVRDELDGGEWKFCEGRPQGHDRFGFCQQGLAAGFTADNHYILFGAPGTYNWKGERGVSGCPGGLGAAVGVHGARARVGACVGACMRVSVWACMHGVRRSGCVWGGCACMHVGVQELVWVCMCLGVCAWGLAACSGCVCVGVHGFGWMDLVVGAPHFFERKEEIGGAAYVYINPGGRWASAAPLRLNGTYGSMFGIALSAAGDLDQDGFSDLAVGAPFDGAGKVYIYHGSKLGIVAKPAQVRG